MKSYIVKNPDILDGTSVVLGTRIPISRILFLFKQGYTIDEISLEYPQLSEKIVASVIEEIAEMYGSKTA